MGEIIRHMRKNRCRIIFFRYRIISPRRDVVFVQNFFCSVLLKVCPILLGKFFKNRQKSEIMNCQFVFIFRHELRRFLDIRTYFIFTQKAQKYTEFAPQVFRHKNIRTYFVFTQRRKGREALCPFVLLSKTLHADYAEPRRRFAKLCAFA